MTHYYGVSHLWIDSVVYLNVTSAHPRRCDSQEDFIGSHLWFREVSDCESSQAS